MLLLPSEATAYICARGRYDTEVRTTGGTLAFRATVQQLLALAAANAARFRVNPKRKELRFAELTIAVNKARRIIGLARGSKRDPLPVADDNRTIYRDGRTFRFHAARSSAFATWRPAVNDTAV